MSPRPGGIDVEDIPHVLITFSPATAMWSAHRVTPGMTNTWLYSSTTRAVTLDSARGYAETLGLPLVNLHGLPVERKDRNVSTPDTGPGPEYFATPGPVQSPDERDYEAIGRMVADHNPIVLPKRPSVAALVASLQAIHEQARDLGDHLDTLVQVWEENAHQGDYGAAARGLRRILDGPQ